MEDLYQIGAILDTHGLKGEVKVFPTTDDVNRFKKLKRVILITKDGSRVELEGAGARFQKNLVLLKFKGIDDINDVEKYKKCNLYVTKEDRVPLKKNEYFVADLIGLEVVSDEEEPLGVITDVLQTGANDVYEVTGDEGVILIPAIHQCILEVDVDAKKMKVHLLEGLR